MLAKFQSSQFFDRIAKKAFGSFGIKIFSLAIAFFTNVVLARLLGAQGFGEYIYAITWVGFLGIPACLGLTEYLVREVAIYHSQKEWGLLRGLLRWSNQLVLSLAITVAIGAAIVVHGVIPLHQSQIMFWLALTTLPLTALTGLRQGAMRGLNQVVQSDIPELLVKPILFVSLIGMVYLLPMEWHAIGAMAAFVVSVAIAFRVGATQLAESLPLPVHITPPHYQTRVWLRGTVPFLWIVAMFVINQQTDILMLGIFSGQKEAGIYNIVVRINQIMQFIVAAVSAATGPTLANLFTQGDLAEIRRVIHQSTRIAFFASLSLAAVIIPASYWLLLIFGPEFVQGQGALIVLCLGYLLASFLELAGLLLLMSGHEKDTAFATGATAGLNVVLNAFLIPSYGLMGAAIATAASTVMRGLYFNYCTGKKLGIIPNPLYR
jgi:O-antigen/teichoic acid export membrane protein